MSLTQTRQAPVQGELLRAELPSAPPAPSVHTRALITWLAIFPLVSAGMLALGPLMENWHPVFRALLLTLLVVPAAVYVVVPKLFAAYGALAKRRAEHAARKQA
ncbi:hypothetical protein [Arthrobacter silvisoli]|uniref:hypothetical protein n=1 Tax=Arthrobacter silvisoli TaxID=2291022 RepID=UPI000E20E011|nr:hypothetical protein [Arthrobacter silvisoli]